MRVDGSRALAHDVYPVLPTPAGFSNLEVKLSQANLELELVAGTYCCKTEFLSVGIIYKFGTKYNIVLLEFLFLVQP